MSGSAFGGGPFGRGPYSDAQATQTPAPIVAATRVRAHGAVDRPAAAVIASVALVLVSGAALWEADATECSAWTPIGGGLGWPASSAGGMFPSAAG